MAFKLSIDEDLLLIRTSSSILNDILFFKHWSYALELPISRIDSVHLEKRAGIDTLVVHKKPKSGEQETKSIPVSLFKAKKNQKEFLKDRLNWIVREHPTYPEIKEALTSYNLVK